MAAGAAEFPLAGDRIHGQAIYPPMLGQQTVLNVEMAD